MQFLPKTTENYRNMGGKGIRNIYKWFKKLLDSQEELAFWNYFLRKFLEVTLLSTFYLEGNYFETEMYLGVGKVLLLFTGRRCFPGSHSLHLWPILNFTFILKIFPNGLYFAFLLEKILLHFLLSSPRANLKWKYFKFAFTCLPQIAPNTFFKPMHIYSRFQLSIWFLDWCSKD